MIEGEIHMKRISLLLLLVVLASGSVLAQNKALSLVIEQILKDGNVITIHYTTTYLQDTQLQTTNWQYSLDNGLTWVPIDAKAISNNNPKPSGKSTIKCHLACCYLASG